MSHISRGERRRRFLQSLPDEDLITDLARRGRLAKVHATMVFYNEYASDSAYMEHIDRDICAMAAGGLYAKGLLTFENRLTGQDVTARVGSAFVLKEAE
jgi:hypothetical protein